MRADLKKRLQQWGRENGAAAFGSFALALVIYVLVQSQISNTETFRLPVELEREAGVALMSAEPATVDVVFRGTFNDLQKLKLTPPRIVVRHPRNREGNRIMVRLQKTFVRSVAGPRIAKLNPSSIYITYDILGEVEFPIEPPALIGTPDRGHASVEIKPRVAGVSGAKKQLERLQSEGVKLKLEAINVDGRTRSFSKTVAIRPPEGAMSPALEPQEVSATVTITRDIAQRDFPAIPVLLSLAPGQEQSLPLVTPDAVAVQLRGWDEELQALTSSLIRVYAALPPTLEPGSNRVPLTVQLLSTNTTIDSIATIPDMVWLHSVPAAATPSRWEPAAADAITPPAAVSNATIKAATEPPAGKSPATATTD